MTNIKVNQSLAIKNNRNCLILFVSGIYANQKHPSHENSPYSVTSCYFGVGNDSVPVSRNAEECVTISYVGHPPGVPSSKTAFYLLLKLLLLILIFLIKDRPTVKSEIILLFSVIDTRFTINI